MINQQLYNKNGEEISPIVDSNSVIMGGATL